MVYYNLYIIKQKKRTRGTKQKRKPSQQICQHPTHFIFWPSLTDAKDSNLRENKTLSLELLEIWICFLVSLRTWLSSYYHRLSLSLSQILERSNQRRTLRETWPEFIRKRVWSGVCEGYVFIRQNQRWIFLDTFTESDWSLLSWSPSFAVS